MRPARSGPKRMPHPASTVSKSCAWSSTTPAPLDMATALSLGQPSRGRTSLSSVSPQLYMARAAAPIFSPNCGSTRMIAGPPLEVRRRWSVPAMLSPASAAPELVGDAVVERVVGGVDDVGGDAHGRPAAAAGVARLDHHPRHRLGCILRRQDAHLVIGEADLLELREGRDERVPQRAVEGVHRAVALGHRHQGLAADIDLDGRLRQRDEVAARVPASLVDDAEALQPEEFRHALQRAARQQLEARLGAVIGIALELALLYFFEEPLQLRVLGVEGDASLAQPRQDVGAPGLIGDEDVTLVADGFRRDVLISARVLLDRRDVQARLVREG